MYNQISTECVICNSNYISISSISISITFEINSAKLYVSVVILSINDSIKYLENIKQEFQGTISWNNYRSEVTAQPKNNNLNYMIEPSLRNINRLYVLRFKNGNNDLARDSFDKYYMPLAEIKVLIH